MDNNNFLQPKITVEKQKHIDSQGSCYSSADVGFLLFIKFCQTKVRYLRIKILIQQYISSFDVSMDNF